ncbi:MAG: ABC transporter substrate-binding protein [Enhydrobacter sp.]|nr:ABC transporter substrate-binding protein [Enhydrobacter sp.]
MRGSMAVGRLAAAALAAMTMACGAASAQEEIVIGQTAPYSGPLSALSVVGNTHKAFFTRLNEQGGITGRKVRLLSLDDGYSPPKTVEMTRQLVERDNALLIFASIGTPTSAAVHRYLNGRKVPQLFVASGASQWADPEKFPWTMGWQISYPAEARIFAKYVLDNIKDAKIAILSQNDDSGKDMVAGLREGLGDAANRLIVRAVTYEVTDPTVDSQVFDLKASGANVFMNFATPKFAAQAIRRAHEAGWRPTQFVSSVSSSVAALKPAGAEAGRGIIVTQFLKDPADAAWKDDPGVREYRAFLEKYYPNGNAADAFGTFAYSLAQTLVQVIQQCGGTVTRERIMQEAANLKQLRLSLLLPGIEVNTSPTDFNPIKQARLARFTGETFELFGEVIDASMARPAKK